MLRVVSTVRSYASVHPFEELYNEIQYIDFYCIIINRS